jgi:Ni/Fe-hydrogenase 1 B-type cytochrome subunit
MRIRMPGMHDSSLFKISSGLSHNFINGWLKPVHNRLVKALKPLVLNTDLNADVSLSFNEKHSLAIRIWHWTFFVVLTASLIMVLLASTVFRTRNTSNLVQGSLQEKGLVASKDQARAVAHAFSDKLWDLHTYIGYILCALLLSRIVIEITQPGEEKLGKKIKKAMAFRLISSDRKEAQQHYLFVKWGYIVFYGLILIMALTGLGLAFEDLPFLKDLHGTIKQIHSFVQYLIYGYILLHVVGVVREDLGRHPGLVSGMIHGKKRA